MTAPIAIPPSHEGFSAEHRPHHARGSTGKRMRVATRHAVL
ncbi:MAG TPA: hypothetical protein VHK70_04995 [Burkholderiaceae bacterium]|nr:hypothetical protein [Burkholderiaceae bacterium]